MKRHIPIIIALWMALMGCIMAEPAQATSVISLGDEKLARDADFILHATILETESFYYDAHTILTRVTVRVHEYLKTPDADRSETFVFYTRGGQFGDVVQTVHGEFLPEKGREIVVFLEKIRKYGGLPMVFGLTQGAFVVDNLCMMRTDRKPALSIRRNREFVRNPSEFDGANDVAKLKSLIKDAIRGVEKSDE